MSWIAPSRIISIRKTSMMTNKHRQHPGVNNHVDLFADTGKVESEDFGELGPPGKIMTANDAPAHSITMGECSSNLCIPGLMNKTVPKDYCSGWRRAEGGGPSSVPPRRVVKLPGEDPPLSASAGERRASAAVHGRTFLDSRGRGIFRDPQAARLVAAGQRRCGQHGAVSAAPGRSAGPGATATRRCHAHTW